MRVVTAYPTIPHYEQKRKRMCRSKTFIVGFTLGFSGFLIVGIIIVAAAESNAKQDTYLCSTLNLHCVQCYPANSSAMTSGNVSNSSSSNETYPAPPPFGFLEAVCNITSTIRVGNGTELVPACCCGKTKADLNEWRCPAFGIEVSPTDWIGFLAFVSGAMGLLAMLSVVVLRLWGCTESVSSDRSKGSSVHQDSTHKKTPK